MKTVRDACQLQENALSIKLSDQIEQLDELISAAGDGAQFFSRTAITQGMRSLLDEGIARLAGASSQAIFHLKQAMGGGKTHLLVGFGLLARNPELRKQYGGGTLYGQSFGEAKIAAWVERIAWIGPILRGEVADTQSWESIPGTDPRKNRLCIASSELYVVWLEPLRSGSWKFSTAYVARAAQATEYKRGKRCVWKV